MKPTAFSYADYEKATLDRDRARLDCAVAERNHMNTLERFLEAQERIDKLQAENKSLRNELCCKCGQYREAHNGACNGCKWRADNGTD